MRINMEDDVKELARELRKQSTPFEKILWKHLKSRNFFGYKFYRQFVIEGYIVDFYSSEAKIVIEVDGNSHYFEEAIQKDKLRDVRLNALGLKVFRITNIDVMNNIDGVLETFKDSNRLVPLAGERLGEWSLKDRRNYPLSLPLF